MWVRLGGRGESKKSLPLGILLNEINHLLRLGVVFPLLLKSIKIQLFYLPQTMKTSTSAPKSNTMAHKTRLMHTLNQLPLVNRPRGRHFRKWALITVICWVKPSISQSAGWSGCLTEQRAPLKIETLGIQGAPRVESTGLGQGSADRQTVPLKWELLPPPPWTERNQTALGLNSQTGSGRMGKSRKQKIFLDPDLMVGGGEDLG